MIKDAYRASNRVIYDKFMDRLSILKDFKLNNMQDY
jgi:hypothetical protein